MTIDLSLASRLLAPVLALGTVFATSNAFALGSPEDARAMLDKAAEAVRSDKDQAFSDFNAGTEDFLQDDLYVFCADEAAYLVAHGANQDLLGTSLLEFQDSDGSFFLAEAYAIVAEGEVGEIDYAWPRPGETEPSQKTALVTKADGILCGVGYYQQ